MKAKRLLRGKEMYQLKKGCVHVSLNKRRDSLIYKTVEFGIWVIINN